MNPGAIFSLLIPMWIEPAPAICQSNSDDAAAARIAFAAGNYQQAANLYEEALARHGPTAELQTDLGLAYQMQGEHSLAIRSYLAALRLEDMPRTGELLAIERCHLRQYHTVTPLLARIAGHLSGDDALLPVLSACYLQAEDAIDALTVSKVLAGSKTMPPDQTLIYRGHASIAASNLFVNQLSKTAGGAPYLEYLKTARDAGSADARGGVPLAIAHSSYLRSDLTLDDGLTLYAGHAGDPALLYMLSVLAGEQAMQSVLDCQQQFSDSPWLAQFQRCWPLKGSHNRQRHSTRNFLPPSPSCRNSAMTWPCSSARKENGARHSVFFRPSWPPTALTIEPLPASANHWSS
jgi:hypothetical protein